MPELTTDPDHPDLGHGPDDKPTPQGSVYLVLSEEERAKGFTRPLRRAYRHVGVKPQYDLVDLTPEQFKLWGHEYAKFEPYPDGGGKFWTKEALKGGCQTVTTMGLALCETYARDPKFYGATYCCGCVAHLRVREFVWIEADGKDGDVVGT
jgi:hypothetical protein